MSADAQRGRIARETVSLSSIWWTVSSHPSADAGSDLEFQTEDVGDTKRLEGISRLWQRTKI